MSTLFASFVDAAAAERAAGALLDHGALDSDLSVIANEAYNSIRAPAANLKAVDAERSAKSGLSTTTSGDVAAGAVKGATVGLGVGIVAALTAMFVPGIGIIIGGGALATALAGGTATVLAGGAAGGVVGYLHDQGVPAEVATRYNADFVAGGAILAVTLPNPNLSSGEIEAILTKYGAANVATYNSSAMPSGVASPAKVPLATDNATGDPLVISPDVVIDVPETTHAIVDAQTGETHVVTTSEVDPVTGKVIEAAMIDPLTGFERPISRE